MKQKRFFSFLLLISFSIALSMTSCGVFSKSRCDRCPEFTEYQYENLEIGEDTEFSAHLDAALDPSNNSN